ncbi:hypothetical protein COO60DRAFT_1704738 [Scenedesmus sp. NREL 46B-D3]|nr:hypothetical protein COO60DRAFT_1704738 [Scenedesmus sp. NREL 46B-D3]
MHCLVAIDGSKHGNDALLWTARHLWKEGMQLNVVTVLPPVAMNVYPVAPVATAAAVAAVTHQWEAQKQQDEAHATEVLREAVQEALAAGVTKSCLHAHALPAAGGASGVGDSIVEFAKAKGVDVVVIGSRGLGSIQRSLMSFVGLGSVSDYVIHQLHVPVLVVHGDGAAAAADAEAPQRKVCIAMDDSVHSQHAASWLQQHVLRSRDEVHVVVVALPVPYPILDETSAAVAALESQQWRASTERSLEHARNLAAKTAAAVLGAAAAAGLSDVTVASSPLLPEGGASDVGASVCQYSQDHKIDLVCLGSRGMGSFKRSLMGFVGLGSVSDYCVHNLGCAVAVIKAEADQLPTAATGGEAQPGAQAAAEAAPASAAEAAAAAKDD